MYLTWCEYIDWCTDTFTNYWLVRDLLRYKRQAKHNEMFTILYTDTSVLSVQFIRSSICHVLSIHSFPYM